MPDKTEDTIIAAIMELLISAGPTLWQSLPAIDPPISETRASLFHCWKGENNMAWRHSRWSG